MRSILLKIKNNKRYLIAYVPLVTLWLLFVVPVQALSLIAALLTFLADEADDLSDFCLNKIGAFKLVAWGRSDEEESD